MAETMTHALVALTEADTPPKRPAHRREHHVAGVGN